MGSRVELSGTTQRCCRDGPSTGARNGSCSVPRVARSPAPRPARRVNPFQRRIRSGAWQEHRQPLATTARGSRSRKPYRRSTVPRWLSLMRSGRLFLSHHGGQQTLRRSPTAVSPAAIITALARPAASTCPYASSVISKLRGRAARPGSGMNRASSLTCGA